LYAPPALTLRNYFFPYRVCMFLMIVTINDYPFPYTAIISVKLHRIEEFASTTVNYNKINEVIYFFHALILCDMPSLKELIEFWISSA
jgi:hypothetical protein